MAAQNIAPKKAFAQKALPAMRQVDAVKRICLRKDFGSEVNFVRKVTENKGFVLDYKA